MPWLKFGITILFLLPEHQFAFITAGVRRGFEATYGPALILFIEVE